MDRLDALAATWTRDMARSPALSVTFDIAEASSLAASSTAAPRDAAPPTSSEALESPGDSEPGENSDDDSLLFDSDLDGDDPIADLLDTDPRMFGQDEDEEDAVHAAADPPSQLAAPVTPSSSPPRSHAASSASPRPDRGAASSAALGSPQASDSDNTSDSEAPIAAPRKERPRFCGDFRCDEDDITCIASRTRWLTGTGLAVFAQSYVVESNNPRLGHLDATACRDVKLFLEGLEEGDEVKSSANKEWVARKLAKVRLLGLWLPSVR